MNPEPITTPRAAERFLARVGVALRYGPTNGLPLASLYRAFAGPRPDKAALTSAIVLTNRLLAESHALEVHVIAERVTLVHRSLIPPLYALVRRGRPLEDLSGLDAASRATLTLLRERKEVTAGDVRRHLGLPLDARQDPARMALAGLERLLLVDRGPFEVPKRGIPYLSREGYPYHLLHEVHPELVRAASRLSVAAAAQAFLDAYIAGARFARVTRLAVLFKAFLSSGEIDHALRRLAEKGTVKLSGSGRDRLASSTRRS